MLGNGRDSRLSASKLTERSRELELTKHGEETWISSFSFFFPVFSCVMYLQAERGLKLLPLRMKHHHNLGWRVMILLRRIYKHQVPSLSGCFFFFFRVAPSVSCSDASARRRWPCLRCVRRPLMSTTYMYVFSASLHASCVSVFFFFFAIFFFLVCFSQQSRRVLFFWGGGG